MKTTEYQALGNVLLLADAHSRSTTVESALRECRFDVIRATTGEEALMRLRTIHVESVFLDPGMYPTGATEACRRIRNEFPDIWIVVMASKDKVEDRVAALRAGADHYITRPFHVQELTARIEAVVRRTRAYLGRATAPIVIGNIHLNREKRVVEKDGREIHLTVTEFNLLYQLMANAGRPIPHSLLLDVVWGDHTATERGYLRIYISQLRKKLEAIPTQPRYLLTYANVGYLFATPDIRHNAIP